MIATESIDLLIHCMWVGLLCTWICSYSFVIQSTHPTSPTYTKINEDWNIDTLARVITTSLSLFPF